MSPRLFPGGDNFNDFINAFKIEPAKDPYKVLSRILPAMDILTLRQQLPSIDLINDIVIQHIWDLLIVLYNEPLSAKGYIGKFGGASFFSALEPTRSEAPIESFSTLSQAINRYIEVRRKEVAEDANLRRVRKVLVQRENRLKRKYKEILAELEQAKTADDLLHKGNVLLAQLHVISQGLTEIELPDIYDINGLERISIRLNPQKSAAANGAAYLKKAKRYKRRLDILPARLNLINKELAEVAQMYEKIQEGAEGLDIVESWYVQRGKAKKENRNDRSNMSQIHPRRYITPSGWGVWAGRNNKENDILSHKIAAQNDIWFHAHGYPGSHVILRREGRKEEPSAQTLKDAAGIAAYWSKGKTAKKVPVVYTLVKYVTKPKGSPPGLALLKREKTLMVEPLLLPMEDSG